MEELLSLVKSVETKMFYTQTSHTHIWDSAYGIGSCIALFLMFISIICLPWFVSLILLCVFVLCIHHHYTIQNHTRHSDSIRKDFDRIYFLINILTSKLDERESCILELHERIKSLQNSSSAYKPKPQIDDILKGHYNALLETIQKLDITTIDFGDECHNYVRKEVEKAARKCNLRFVDYSESTADCYIIEHTDVINKIDYVARGIVSNEDNQVVLKGQVYLPSN